MKRGFVALLGFVGGAATGWLLSMATYILITDAGMAVDRDGGLAMGFAFTIGSVVGVLLGIAGAFWAVRRHAGP